MKVAFVTNLGLSWLHTILHGDLAEWLAFIYGKQFLFLVKQS